MVGAKRRVRIGKHGHVPLPADLMRRHRLSAGDEVDVEETEQGLLIIPQVGEAPMSADREARLAPPTAEELTRRKAAVDRIMAHRATMPSIAPLTTADLVHMSRDDNFWYGEEEAAGDGVDDH